MDVEKKEHLHTMGRNINYGATMENITEKINIKNRTTILSRNSTLVNLLKKTKTIIKKCICPYVHCTIISNNHDKETT